MPRLSLAAFAPLDRCQLLCCCCIAPCHLSLPRTPRTEPPNTHTACHILRVQQEHVQGRRAVVSKLEYKRGLLQQVQHELQLQQRYKQVKQEATPPLSFLLSLSPPHPLPPLPRVGWVFSLSLRFLSPSLPAASPHMMDNDCEFVHRLKPKP
jgi:hypothetical protein